MVHIKATGPTGMRQTIADSITGYPRIGTGYDFQSHDSSCGIDGLMRPHKGNMYIPGFLFPNAEGNNLSSMYGMSGYFSKIPPINI